MIIKSTCKFCNKPSDITSEIPLDSGKLLIFKCGHSYVEESLAYQETIEGVGIQNKPEQIELSLYERLKRAVPIDCETHMRRCITEFSSHSGKHLFPYQRDGIIAAYENNVKFIFNDEMGLGKTIQGLVTIALNPEKLLPGIFVCKSIAKTNWLWETMDILQMPAQVIGSSSETPWDMFKIHIISFDLMNRLDKMFKFSDMKPQIECPECNYRCDEGQRNLQVGSFCPSCAQTKRTEGNRKQESFQEGNKIITDFKTRVVDEIGKEVKMIQWFDKSIGVGGSLRDTNKLAWTKIIQRCKTIILDEVHLLKNPESQRSKALKIVSSMIPHKMCMSGTLIKNNATEYFVPLNIVKPEKFWRYKSFCRHNVRLEAVRTVTGKISNRYTGLIYPKEFLKSVSDCMIRRTTDEVLPELPKLWKQQKYAELEENFKAIYDESEKDFAKWFDSASDIEIRLNLLVELARLRHQTSLAKIDFTIDLVLEFLLQTNKKIAIFTHHIDSREFLANRMIEFFKETSPDNPSVVRVLTQASKDVQQEIEDFKNSETERVVILSTLAHGESINLQFMSDCILHERQWNPANEDQAISGRFRRIGQAENKITCQIPVALGTIDEYFVESVERKRGIASEIDTGIQSDPNDSDFVRDLAERIASKGRLKWRL